MMISSSTQEKIMNFILAGLVVCATFVFVSCFYDFYYDLNDDMVIKDILAGAYSGRPSGYTNQILYPLGWLLSSLYCLLPKVPIFGIFLCACFGMCFWMISYRMQEFFQKQKVKIVTTALMIALFLGLMLWELVYVQYSVVSGVLAGTACFWFCTTDVSCSIGEFWKKNIPSLLLVWLAFLVRSEMLLLTTPFIAAVGILHWAEATKYQRETSSEIGRAKLIRYIFSKENLFKYVGFIAAILLGMGIFLGIDTLAFGDAKWQEYREFFDVRTKVYDYTWYPDYEEQQTFYEENEISEVQYSLIHNYNFALDETIDSDMLETIASYGEKTNKMGSIGYRIKNSVYELLKRSFSLEGAPYNYYVIAGYALVIGLAVLQKDKKYICKIVLLAIMRTIPWMYLIYAGRVVDRIAHPLYMVELFILLAFLVRELYDRPLWNEEHYYRMLCAGILAVLALISIPTTMKRVEIEQLRREQILVNQSALDDYAKANGSNYYYIDVYSTVSFVEKMFDDVDNTQKNYDLLGGWVAKSPLQQEAITSYVVNEEVDTMVERLLEDNFYFVIAKNRDSEFVKDFYKSKEINVTLDLVETVGEGENPFQVYKLEKQSKPIKRNAKK